MKRPAGRRAVAEEHHRHLVGASNLAGERGAGPRADAARDDAVGAEDVSREVGDVHGAALGAAASGGAAEQLRHHALHRRALREAVAVAAVGAEHVVVVAQVGAHSDRDRLLAAVHVQGALDGAEAGLAKGLLLEQTDAPHVGVELAAELGGEGHETSCIVVVSRGVEAQDSIPGGGRGRRRPVGVASGQD